MWNVGRALTHARRVLPTVTGKSAHPTSMLNGDGVRGLLRDKLTSQPGEDEHAEDV